MQLGGYTKLTLLDYTGFVSAMCFTKGCQLRCPFCHNAELVLPKLQKNDIDAEKASCEFFSYLEQRKSMLDGVVVTGGEPLLQKDLEDFLLRIKNLGLSVKLDTNGLMTEKLKKLIENKLVDYIAMDYKNTREHFCKTVGIFGTKCRESADKYYDNWENSLDYLRKHNVPYELRTTVIKELHPLSVLLEMAQSIQYNAPADELWFIQKYVRNTPVINDYQTNKIAMTPYTTEEMKDIEKTLSESDYKFILRN